MKKLLSIVLAVALPGLLLAQTTVTGTVTDSQSGDPLVGANVYIDALSIGAAADTDGNYRISIPGSVAQGQSVEIQAMYIGYKRGTATITLTPGGTINQDFTLEVDVIGLEEVVVTALGITREKKALGYAVQEISGDEFTETRVDNFLNALAGKVAGVQITASSSNLGASSRIILRGNGSLSGNNQPLFVVDGVPIDNSIGGSNDSYLRSTDFGNGAADINPSDIESVSVLRGPNAAAIYGSRGANGVIVITTKSAKAGLGKRSSGIGITYETHYTTKTVTSLPKFQDKYGQGSDGRFEYVDGNGAGTFDWVDESWGPEMDIGLNIAQWNSPVVNGVRSETPWVSHPDNVESFFDTGTALTHSLSFSGTDTKTHFRMSLTNSSEIGIFPNTDQTRNTITFNGGVQITPKMSANASFSYVRTENDNLPGGGYSGNNPMQQMGNWFGRQVDMDALRDWKNADGTPNRWNYSYHDNPFWIMNMNTNSRLRDRLYGNFTLNYKLTSGLSIMARYGTDWYNQNTKQIRSMYTSDYIQGWFRAADVYRNETNADVIATLNMNMGAISINATAGANIRDQHSRSQSSTVDGLIIPELYSLSNASGVPSTGYGVSRLKENSVYGAVSVGIGGFLYIDATARNDWSSTLPSENRSYFYPSLTTSLIFSELLGISPSLMYGKLRASWAQVGNSTTPYATVGVYSAGNPFNGNANLSYGNTLANINLKPELTESIELGAEMKFFNNRIGFDATYYNAQTTNQILSVSTSRASGYSAQRINAGQVTNKGIELSLYASPIRGDNFSWDIIFNYAKNENTVDELFGDMERLTLWYGTWGMNVVADTTGAYGDIRGRAVRRDPDGKIIIGSDGSMKRADTLATIGNVIPDWIGGLSNTIRMGPFHASALIDIHMGGDLLSITNAFGIAAGVFYESVWASDTYPGSGKAVVVSASGDTTYAYGADIREHGLVVDGVNEIITNEVFDGDGELISADTSYVANTAIIPAEDWAWDMWNAHEMRIFDASYIKLRSLSLGVDLPQSLINGLGITKATLSIEGRNLAILMKNSPHIDPETAGGSGPTQGIEVNQPPSTKQIGINLRLVF